ncbi:dihydroorotate dehydrogenase-like protein [uncultured Proteiniphilum sp.]|uniref:dihydroorotate dehydrogenase-like protein n=1 Tax=uncultured Proteiniphilum sp. TaxID=497637 RepID=UPI0026131354|nr:dihydroorotate dehydrogenase-like protein [uncultured Proteiniphilum sp.]
MKNLETSYMGIQLKNPVILGASELSSEIDSLKKAEQAGAAAIVYKTLFEEQIQLEDLQFDELKDEYNDIHAEMTSLYPDIDRSEIEYYLVKIRNAKENLSVPVIASLNAVNESSWFRYARLIEETGVDGIELNLYQTPTQFDLDAAEIERRQIAMVTEIKKQLSIPVSVKLSSDYTNILHFAKRLDEAGVDGMVLFNSFFQPDIDIEKESHRRAFNLSKKGDYKQSLRIAGMLYGRVNAAVCASRGVFNGDDVIKLILSGATCVQVVSAVYRHGMKQITEIIREVEEWMERKGYDSIEQFRGKLSDSILNKNDNLLIYKRAQYVDLILHSDTIYGNMQHRGF